MISRPSMGHIHDFGNLHSNISANFCIHNFVFAYLFFFVAFICTICHLACSDEPIQVLYVYDPTADRWISSRLVGTFSLSSYFSFYDDLTKVSITAAT